MPDSCPEPRTAPAGGALPVPPQPAPTHPAPPHPAPTPPELPQQRSAEARPAPGWLANPVVDTGPGRDHGDPFVLRWQGRYHLYVTGSTGIEVWTSSDLAHWTGHGPALQAPDGDHWAQVDLWAPEVVYADGEFLMYVTGTRHLPPGVERGPEVGVDSGDDALRRQGVARARHPLGPFTLDDAPLLDVWSIDGHPFTDVDGRRWLFYNVRDDTTRYAGTIPGCGNLVDELVAPDAVRGTPTPVTLPDAAWEGNRDGSWYWNEGPTVLRHRGRYVQMYSGGWYGDDTYGVGFAVADDVRGPWVKAPHNPIFVSGGRITGPGHHCVTVGPDGVTPYAVYHGYVDGAPGRKVHVDRLTWSVEGPRIGSGALPGHPTGSPQPVPDEPAYDAAVPFWHAELWVRAVRLDLGSVHVELPSGRDALVEVTLRGQVASVVVDGRLVVDGAVAGDAAAIARALRGGEAVAGDVRSLALTSWRQDAEPVELTPGAVLAVPWGGGLPVELTVAVHGDAEVRVLARDATPSAPGGTVLARETVRAGDHAVVVRLRTQQPADRVEVVATGRVVVGDLVLTARPAAAAAAVPAPRVG